MMTGLWIVNKRIVIDFGDGKRDVFDAQAARSLAKSLNRLARDLERNSRFTADALAPETVA